MWRLIRNVTGGGAEGEVAPTDKIGSNATKVVANLTEEIYKGWRLLKEGEEQLETFEQGGYNSNDHNDTVTNTYNLENMVAGIEYTGN